MRHLLYFAFIAASTFFGGVAAQVTAFDYSDPAVVGGTLHECYRECVANDVRTCYYEFTANEWLTMNELCDDCPYTQEDCYNVGCNTAGGDVRLVTVVNHMLPGPSIQVCKGDIIQIKVNNQLGSEVTTIHWHGISQVDTPYMDGVPFLTQCPILPGTSFVYNFTADPAGTHMWHSHAGFQESDGFHGSLIVREPEDVNADYYDYDLPEHVMIVWHWYSRPTAGEAKTALLDSVAPVGYSLTVNGYGKNLVFPKDGIDYYTPSANFTVTQGNRYRFRAIANAGVYCPIQVSVDDHTLLVLATDGASVEPIEVDSIIINAGERYDFVLTADQPIENYWIRYRGFGSCESVSTTAILSYEGAGDAEPSGTTEYDDAKRSGVLLNPVQEADMNYSNNTLIRVPDLITTIFDTQDVSGTPDYTLYMPIAMNLYPEYETSGPYGQIDNMSFVLPSIPLLTQHDEITSDMYCTPDDKSAQTCKGGLCTCPMVYPIPKDALVEVFLFDTTARWTDDHPIHFHSRKIRIVASRPGNGTAVFTAAELQAMNEAGLVDKNLETAPLKDTIGVPARGFVVVRARVDNPGYWLAHCHIAAHFEEGMGVVFKIGEDSEMNQAPAGFPTCGGDYDIRNQS